ncbi:MAG: 30S ribosomal protein S6 [Candidatus Kerfeldbacteria bacterium CG_4_10_14_0_8_um_filter_42_10]|uniref:Small ribosomal subunit protein bS6 n=1 Tax=Candidatus Kerfeldbacteria bacterium CG_4_10_14_0_8_um_filter_42_10 TaxID=2014248 RepID=A0A2M7RI21_9BACT|nr:MAG: 30S ribosomal protein S6 [Candidatus Kerfeldbacteria bacterium CG_4_10_14_0_8_um_filter_42_10]
MQHYETLIIISSRITEEELPFIVDKIFAVLKKGGGEITRNENLGKKKLSYAIKQSRYGFYVLIEFNLPAEKYQEVEKELGLMEEIIRHQTIKTKEKTETDLERERMLEKSAALRQQEEDKKEKKLEAASTSAEKIEPKTKEKTVVPPKKKISLEELDEKLDKILGEDMIK